VLKPLAGDVPYAGREQIVQCFFGVSSVALFLCGRVARSYAGWQDLTAEVSKRLGHGHDMKRLRGCSGMRFLAETGRAAVEKWWIEC